jgi:outer membrane protein insertion porin family
LRSLLIALLICSIAATAQTRRKPKTRPAVAASNKEATSWPLDTLSVEGNHAYSQAQVLAVAGLRAGQTVGKPDFEAARERLLATGAFETVGYSYAPAANGKGYSASFEVVEVTQLFPLMFQDLPVDDAQIRAWLKQKDPLFEPKMFGPKIPATEPALNRYKQLVSEYLAAHNYHEPISARLASEAPPELAVVFRPEAPRPSIARIIFANTGEIAAGDLQTAMYPVAIGVVYSEARFRQLLDTTIRPLYEAHGYLRVAFPKIDTQAATDVKGIVVTTQVEQGPVYKLAAVAFAGTTMAAEDLQKVAKLKTGELANFDEIKLAQSRIEQTIRRSGYMRVNSRIVRNLHDAEKTVDVTFQIEPGPQFTFGKLTIAGLDITSEPTVRKMWGLKEGKPFNPEYPDHFLDVVKEQGLFDNLKSTLAETKVNTDTKTVDVTLYFKGGSPAR